MNVAPRKPSRKVAQAWVELISEDPEALSALEVARRRLDAGRGLERLRRVRLLELTGPLPARDRVEALLHGSTQFYNPHKERCTVRLTGQDPAPLADGERAVLVFEKDGVRRPAAERWWRHETGDAVEVAEGTVWALTYDMNATPEAIEDLARVQGRGHGLLSNPHSQDYRIAKERVPLPWLTEAGLGEAAGPTRSKGARPSRRKR
jgi:hypothetical protein